MGYYIRKYSGGNKGDTKSLDYYPDPYLMNPLPLIGIIIGIRILRPLEGGGLLITGLHYS